MLCRSRYISVRVRVAVGRVTAIFRTGGRVTLSYKALAGYAPQRLSAVLIYLFLFCLSVGRMTQEPVEEL